MKRESAPDWLNRMQRKSEILNRYVQQKTWDDTMGWGGRLYAMWQLPPSSRPSGLLLTGPEGCGKHTAAAHTIKLLLQEGYLSFQITGNDLLAGAEEFDDLRGRVDALLTCAYEQNRNLCLTLEQIETCPWRGELLDYLGEVLCDYLTAEESVFLILMETQQGSLPALLRQMLQQCRFGLPTLEQRMDFLQHSKTMLWQYADVKLLAEETEHFTFAQLVDLASCLSDCVDQHDLEDGSVPDAEELISLIRSQRPSAGQRSVQERLLELLDTLPERLQTLFESGVQIAAPTQKTEQTEQKDAARELTEQQIFSYRSQEESRIRNLPFYDLAQEVLGEEFMQTV